METNVLVNGNYQTVALDVVKEIQETSIVFSSVGEIHIDIETINYVKEIIKNNEDALFAINTEKSVVLLDFEVPETGLTEELEGACE